jgi:hypothetical protein
MGKLFQNRPNSPNARSNRFLFSYAEPPHFRGVFNMRAAAKLFRHRVALFIKDRVHFYGIGIFFFFKI